MPHGLCLTKTENINLIIILPSLWGFSFYLRGTILRDRLFGKRKIVMKQELLLMLHHLSSFFLLGAIVFKFLFTIQIFTEYKRESINFVTFAVLLAIFAGQIFSDLAWLNYIVM